MALDKNTPPYYDDYDSSKKYYQILFKPDVAVQARELTQLQTTLQKQIDFFGKHVFKEGSMVIPGETAIDFDHAFVKLEETYSSTEVNISNFTNKTITGVTSGAVAKVVGVVEKTSTDPKTLYVKYVTGNSTLSATANTTNTSSTISNLSINALTDLVVGMKVTGVGIPTGSYIKTINSASSITINSACTATATGVSISFVSASVFQDNETLVTLETTPAYATSKTSSATGFAAKAFINQGVYFINGYFCLVDTQSLVIEKYSSLANCKVGLSYQDAYITVEEDITLVDQANITNTNAIGADRYYIDVVLTKIALDDDVPSNFIELVRIENGAIQSMVTKTQYSELEKTLARRTYDESGDYTVRSFPLQVREHLNDGENYGVYTAPDGDESKLVYALDTGKAYVRGYEIELQSSKFINIDKPRSFNSIQNQNVSATYGSFVYVNNISGTYNISTFEDVDLVDGTSATIGTAKCRGLVFVSGTPGNSAAIYKLFLFDIQLDSGKTFSDIRTFETASASATAVLEDTKAVLYDPSNISNIKKIDEYAVKTVSDISYITRRYNSGVMSGSSITITGGVNEIFSAGNAINYHVSIVSASATAISNGYADGDVVDITDVSNSIVLGGSPVGRQVTLTMPDISGSTVAIISTVTKTNATVKTKTLTTTSETVAHASTITLNKADIFEIVSITDVVTSADITDRYYVDNGQRDTHYDRGILTFKSEYAAPSGNVTISYKYFAHGAGDVFTVDSYIGSIDYSDIQIFTSKSSGETYDLINCLDFRPRMNDSGTGFSVVSEMIADGQSATFDYDYYLGRIDKIVLDSAGEFSVISGVSDISPLPPKDPQNAMVLYQVVLPPYTFSASDVTFKMIDNKRYTMRDIGKLERRIENLEYYTTLSLLEKSTSDMFIDDGTGVNRFKNGFVVDNFKSHLVGDSSLYEYQCSVDAKNGELRPPFVKDAVDLELYTDGSTNYTKTGTLLTLPYTHTKFISQPYASKTMNVNPYAIYSWVGNVMMSPSSDTWFETTRLPDYVITSEEQLSNEEAALIGSTIWGEWETNWAGTQVTKTQIKTGGVEQTSKTVLGSKWGGNARKAAASAGVDISLLSNTSSNDTNHRISGTATYLVATTTEKTRTNLVTDVEVNTTTETTDDRVVSSTVIPFIREKLVYFTGKGLKPNTRVYPLFDNIVVSTYCRPDVVGSSYGDSLITDNNGTVSGYFNIPCTDGVKFRTGERTFKLVDNVADVYNSLTSAETIYSASGTIQTKQATILSTKRHQLVQKEITEKQTTTIQTTESKKVNISWGDPLAQTFLIENEDGVFLSKINVYFASKDTSGVPVRLQIRNVVNGYPGQYVVPLSDTFLNPSDVNLSDDGTTATTFTFESPVYLSGGNEYCFVLLSNSNSYNVWISELGGVDLATGSRISQQPYAGVMFKSQNASTWSASQEEDIKFDIYRCSFNTSVNAEIVFKNGNVSSQKLAANPFTTTNTSKTITVYQQSHGFISGNTVTISGVSGTQNGIPSSQINGEHEVTVVDFDRYTITLGTLDTAANVSGICGGSDVFASKNITIDSMNLNAQVLSFSNTSIDTKFKGTDISNTKDTDYVGIVMNDTINLLEPKYLMNSVDENSSKSVDIKTTLTSNTDWISPVVDTERMSLICVSNRINNISTNETAYNSGDAIARYVTRKVTLASAANSLHVYFSAVRPSNASIKVYAKFQKEGDQTSDFNKLAYVEVPAVDYPNFDDTTLKDYSFSIDTDEYISFSVKIVMLSSETSDVPIIKEFRAIATGT